MRNNRGSTLVEALGAILIFKILFAGLALIFALSTAQLATNFFLDQGLVAVLAGKNSNRVEKDIRAKITMWTPWVQIESLRLVAQLNYQMRKETRGQLKWCLRLSCEKTKKNTVRFSSERRIKALRI